MSDKLDVIEEAKRIVVDAARKEDKAKEQPQKQKHPSHCECLECDKYYRNLRGS